MRHAGEGVDVELYICLNLCGIRVIDFAVSGDGNGVAEDIREQTRAATWAFGPSSSGVLGWLW